MSELENIGLSLISQEILKEILPYINENIVDIIYYFNDFFVRYRNGNMYCMSDEVNIHIKKSIEALLEIQKNIINVPDVRNDFYSTYMKLMTTYFVRKIGQLEGYIKENDIYCLRPVHLLI